MSAFIGFSAMVLPLLASKPLETVEQSNDIFFIVFSLFCFSKFLTLFTHVILKNRIIRKSIMLIRHTWPFVVKMMTLYGLILIFYAYVGRILYGGRIQNLSVNDYTVKTGLLLRQNYKYFHFNDIFSSFLTLFVLLMQNNWVFVVEMLYFVRNDSWTVLFIVSYNMIATFIMTSLFYGVIARLIMIYFENDFDHFEVKKSEMQRSLETATNQSESIEGSVVSDK